MNRWRRITRGFNGPRSSTGGFAWIAGGTREDGWCSICNRGRMILLDGPKYLSRNNSAFWPHLPSPPAPLPRTGEGSCFWTGTTSKRNSCYHDGKKPYFPPHAARLPRLSAGGDDSPRTPHGNGPAGLSFLRLQSHRHAGPGVPGDPHRQGRRRDRQATLSLPGRRRACGRAAVRSHRAAGPFCRAAHRRVGHALQTIPHRHRVARRKAPGRPLPRVHAVRLRHDRHPLHRLRYRDGAW